MNTLQEDLNESDLFCKTLNQKRKATESVNPKCSKQLKLNFTQASKNKDYVKEDSNSLGDKILSHKNQDSNSKCSEFQSGYFQLQKSVNTCPLCLKSFKTDSLYSAHMKQCAKTHKMTTKELLGALEVQRKQMKDRDLRLYPQIVSQKKTVSQKRIEKEKESYDLALGLALSKSLTTNESKIATLLEAPKSTLKEFGFTSSDTAGGVSRPIKRKTDGDKKSLLRLRTEEERQRIIIEKVAVVLLDEDKEQSTESKQITQNFSLQNVQVPQLWSKGENNWQSDWYVHEIKKLLLLEEHNEEEFQESVPDNIDSEIAKLNLPQKDISNDWRKVINNKELSDFVGNSRDGEEVHVHLVVLYARCPELLKKNYKSIFEKFNQSTILIFMEYIYCGTLSGLVKTELDNLYNLASEFDFKELIQVLNTLKNNLSGKVPTVVNRTPDIIHQTLSEEKVQEITVIEREKVEMEEEECRGGNLEDLSHNEDKTGVNSTEASPNTDKSFWSFMQHEKEIQKLNEMGKQNGTPTKSCEEEKANLESSQKSDELKILSDDSVTKDWGDIQNGEKGKTDIDCVVLSSGSETKSVENFMSQQVRSRTPSPVSESHDPPLFEPFDNFHCFSGEPFSPVGVLSQSLISGDVSIDSLKENSTCNEECQEEPKQTVGYCSTPVKSRRSSKIEPSTKNSLKKSKRKCDPSSSRLLRKSLGLHQRNSISNSFKNKRKVRKKSLEEALTNSVLNELSKCSTFDCSPLNGKDFVEITPISNRDEIADSVTPSPNYSNMGEAMLKEQLTKYGLKKNLAKSKAKKILRLIYEELHPLYNVETGKLVKVVPRNTPKCGKKSKSKNEKVGRSKQTIKDSSKRKRKTSLGSFNDSKNSSDESTFTLDRASNHSSEGSDFESLNETLTQSVPTNSEDLPSAFCEFLQNNPEYHQKILLYEPIWLEELQKELKDYFKKHFKMADLMSFLDQKCIAFRSVQQAKKLQKRYEKKKEKSRKTKKPSEENSS